MKLISGAACALILGTAVASAAPVTFDFTGGSGQMPVASYSVDDLTLSVTALALDDSGARRAEQDAVVTTGALGLGVRNRVGTGDDENNVFVDGRSQLGFNDMLVFALGARITSATVTFAERDGFGASRFVHYAPGAGGLEAVPGEVDIDGPWAFAPEARAFGLAAFGDDDHFLVSSLTVDTAPMPVPVPAAGGLMLLGLAGLGLLRRRR